jgi:hypothetical protein
MERELFTARRNERQGKRGGPAAGVRTLRLDSPVRGADGDDAFTLADVLADPGAEMAIYRIEGEERAALAVERVERLVGAGTLSRKAADALYAAARGEPLAALQARHCCAAAGVGVPLRAA